MTRYRSLLDFFRRSRLRAVALNLKRDKSGMREVVFEENVQWAKRGLLASNFKLNRAYLFMLLGALINATMQLSSFVDKGEIFRQFDITFSEFLRQFSWLMMLVTAGFFGLIGHLYQRKVDEREEALEIEMTMKARHSGPDLGKVEEKED
jgi:hypothetical protein